MFLEILKQKNYLVVILLYKLIHTRWNLKYYLLTRKRHEATVLAIFYVKILTRKRQIDFFSSRKRHYTYTETTSYLHGNDTLLTRKRHVDILRHLKDVAK